MNLDEQKITGIGGVSVTDSLEAPLLSIKVKRTSSTTVPSDTTDLIVYVDKSPKTSPTASRKQFVFELSKVLGVVNSLSDEFVLEVKTKDNDIKSQVYVKRNVNNNAVLETPTIELLDESLINLFEGTNYIYTNYTNDSIEIIYPKNDELNQRYLNNAIFCYHRQNSQGDFSLDDIYFKDAFTKTEDKLNIEVDNANISCLTSKNNKFSLDENGNLVVNSITTNNSESMSTQTICNIIYPIGSIYLSVSPINPTTLFGGTWEQIKDKFLLACGDTYSNGVTGGESKHTLTTSEMPSHRHGISRQLSSTTQESKRNAVATSYIYTYELNQSVSDFTGGGESHNNMPPYLAVYIWKRIA